MSEQAKNRDGVPEDKLNAIKEIIFGENIKAYESEFKQLKDEIIHQKSAIDQEIAAVKNEIRQMMKEVGEKMDSLRAELKALDKAKSDRNKLGELLEEMAKKLKE